MATLLLQAAGGMLGGAFGAFGAKLGTAAGAMAGYWVDQRLFGPNRDVEGLRLTQTRLMTAEEGTPIARAYGHVRLAGTVIWATRFEEEKTTTRQGGKGGPKATTYSYYGNVAIALCEGLIAMVKRVWADGREIDLTELNYRVYLGTGDQPADPLIEARQGIGNAPAYRGVAYLVFERMPLEVFGNRIPQIQAEVIRPVGTLEQDITAISMIPGATEHGLSPEPATSLLDDGETIAHNRHILYEGNDWRASADELLAICPNLKHVSLVVTWYGRDLRAGVCDIRPGVTERNIGVETPQWCVSGLLRQDEAAMLVSRVDGRAAYGGTPTDASVIAVVRDMTARGIKVMLHPFIMMDVPSDNALPDPYGGVAQAPYPWRGRITCHPAPNMPGTTDRTAQATSEIAAFLGTTQPGDIGTDGETIVPGPGADWGYRRFIFHMARLVQIAGGVDAMLIGSELRGLTWVRDESDGFPFVNALSQIAQEVRAIVGPDVKLSYGADWSECFGYHPPDGSGDVYYHLDPLWAAPQIDAVGIDNYMPLSDWRDGDALSETGNPDGMRSSDDGDAMLAMVAAGEGFDWYYASIEDRLNRVRTPITDGSHGKPWVYRYKDLAAWWSNAHHDRRGGVELSQPSAWVPRGKPIWLTELGCPAVEAGGNQPNVFPDPKSSESAQPYFSNGARGDNVQRAFLMAHARHWSQVGTPVNPYFPGTSMPMLNPDRIYLWSWDARPFPEFPRSKGVWGDGDNWLIGHWLNGRLGTAPLADLVTQIFADHGLPAPDVSRLRGVVQGMTVDRPSSIRQTLEPLVDAFGLVVTDTGTDAGPVVRFAGPDYQPVETPAVMLCERDAPGNRKQMSGQANELPAEVVVRYRDAMGDYITASVRSRRREGPSARVADLNLPCTLDPDAAERMANQTLARLWAGRDTLRFDLPLRFAGLEPGDVIAFDDSPKAHWRITGIDITDRLEVSAVSEATAVPAASKPSLPSVSARPESEGRFGGPPDVVLLDLPLFDAAAPTDSFRIAARSSPQATLVVTASAGIDGFETRQVIGGNAVMGRLAAPLAPGPVGQFDRVNVINVMLASGELASVSDDLLLSGRNLIAIEAAPDQFEVLQFGDAEEIAQDHWRLTRLLRGQGGTEDVTVIGAPTGARLVLLDERVPAAGLRPGEAGLSFNWRIGPQGKIFSDRYFTSQTAVGGERALLPLAPVHLRAVARPDGGLDLSWVRRTRIDGDAWAGPDVPLGEDYEAYRLELFDNAGASLQTVEATTSGHSLTAAEVQSLFGAMPATVDVEVRQISACIGPGVPARTSIPVTYP